MEKSDLVSVTTLWYRDSGRRAEMQLAHDLGSH